MMTVNLLEDKIIKNISEIAKMETALRSFVWILPGRFKDAELASESGESSI